MIEDIYGDLDEDQFEMGETIKQLQEKNAELTTCINELTIDLQRTTKDLEEVKKANIILQQNISKLFNTAKADYERRTRIISDLRAQLDDLVFKRNKGQAYKIPKRKPDIQIEVNEPESKKRKINDEENISKMSNIDRKNTNNVLKDCYKSDNKRDKSNKRRNFRRSRSRSRERRRKSPYRRSERDYDRNRSKRYSPERNRKNNDGDEDTFEKEQKYLLEMINRKKQNSERSDSESIITLHSSSSVEEIKESKSEEKSKNKKNDTKKSNKSVNADKNNVKVEVKVEKMIKIEEIEEGEVSEDESDKKRKTPKVKSPKKNRSKKESATEENNKNKDKNTVESSTNKNQQVSIKKEPIAIKEENLLDNIKIERTEIKKINQDKSTKIKKEPEKSPDGTKKLANSSKNNEPATSNQKESSKSNLLENDSKENVSKETISNKNLIENAKLDLDIKNESLTDQNMSHNESISDLLAESEKLKRQLEEMEREKQNDSITDIENIKTENTTSEQSLNCSTEKPLNVSDTCKENLSNNVTSEIVQKKPKRRRCVIIN